MNYDYEANARWHTSNMNKVYSFNGKKVLDIGCGDGDMVRIIASQYDPNHVYGVDKYLRKPEKDPSGRFTLIDNVNANQLPFDDNSFDFVYSISTFEHIEDVAGTLSEVRRVLKPMGKFYTTFSPIWTSVAGHHVYCVAKAMRSGMDRDEELVEAIPAWGHLYMTEEEMAECLSKTDIPEERVKYIVNYIYHHEDINRHTASRTRDDIIKSGMIVRRYSERVSFSRKWALDQKGDSELSLDIIERIKKTNYSLQDIGIVGMSAELEKYASF